MSIRLEMLQAARAAPKLLPDARDRVVAFVRNQAAPDGGFKGRAEGSDLYYTVFGIECILALDAELPTDRIVEYLRSFGDGESLDFVHLACLARCWAHMDPVGPAVGVRESIADRVEGHRAPDGGYSQEPDAGTGTAYAAFLALGAYQDLGREPPEKKRLADSLQSLRSTDGGYGNTPGIQSSSTPATAAAVMALRHMGEAVPSTAGTWLLKQRHASGGFVASRQAPVPDLLSTATALHAVVSMGFPLDSETVERCLDFLDSLWSPEGGFCGTWADRTLDCEYTYYGLLALGNLARAERAPNGRARPRGR